MQMLIKRNSEIDKTQLIRVTVCNIWKIQQSNAILGKAKLNNYDFTINLDCRQIHFEGCTL